MQREVSLTTLRIQTAQLRLRVSFHCRRVHKINGLHLTAAGLGDILCTRVQYETK